ncbi:MAG: PIN domain-containing protein [Acidobacteriota bacterium]|nr:PIN domain-containing protein [Acidobacteriota bacterium]
MIKSSIADTGIIVALLDKKDKWHEWTLKQMHGMAVPFLTCEAVITEACFLVAHLPDGKQKVLQLVSRGVLQIDFSLSNEIEAIENLVKKYADVLMDLADACLVRLCELHENSVIFTVDSDFLVYRKNGKKEIPLIIPNERRKTRNKRKN